MHGLLIAKAGHARRAEEGGLLHSEPGEVVADVPIAVGLGDVLGAVGGGSALRGRRDEAVKEKARA